MRIILRCVAVWLLGFSMVAGFYAPAFADVVSEDVTYTLGEQKFIGHLAYDDQLEGRRPGIIVVHEWWGHNDYARRRARQLAALGYTALSIDMYGDGKTADHPNEAGMFAKQATENLEEAKARFLKGMDVLKAHPTVDPTKIAAIGYCFGGSTVLHMARQGVDLKGVVSFHGGLTTTMPAQPGVVKAKVLVCHGADDEFITEEQIADFKKEMMAAQADLTFSVYEGAKHSFTNADADEFAKKFGMPVGYNVRADQLSWEDMQGFFNTIFNE